MAEIYNEVYKFITQNVMKWQKPKSVLNQAPNKGSVQKLKNAKVWSLTILL